MKPKQILLVDDEESLRRVTQLELEDLGFSVSTVADGQEALNLWPPRHSKSSLPT